VSDYHDWLRRPGYRREALTLGDRKKMMNQTDTDIGPQLRDAITQFLVPLQTMQPVNVAAFERLHALAVDLLHCYKDKEYVSKSLLHELHTSIKIITAETAHRAKERQVLEDMTAKLQMCFDLLLIGETPEKRNPGIPRIV
jgi:hypothetical protein